MTRTGPARAADPPVRHETGVERHPEWYRTAVFYEVLVRAFGDSTGGGTGDIAGLVRRLDYLQWLGIDCLWVPPFYASPLRDGGYDITDHTAVLPELGTLPDLERLVAEAHARGIRIVIDLVMNHTSDQHPWFQASRSDPDGPFGDFYVWSDTDDGYADARVIFSDTETSNWTFDVVRRQFFWHRFFSHQPDLNFENPAVHEAVFDIVRFWLDLGVDGLRLDAVPYLYEEEGHNGENHPKTHEFLATLRAMVDREYPDRLLLAEANQPPAEVVDYFGTRDRPECHMCFHFPVMPMIYYALRAERAAPISEVLAATPPIPPGAQWGTFLRNHDELTLEMVTTEQRAALYGWYAPDPRMRANVGIRRRLAPLLDNDRDAIELAHALLLSLPGSPCLYYGDEIGMGDNIWLPDRDGVRTPMQWTPDRNAGFSTADPGRLYLPVVDSLVHNRFAVNVEMQQSSGSSLLSWVRRLLAVRRRHPVFGVGDFRVVPCDNEAVLAFTRTSPTGPPDAAMPHPASPEEPSVTPPAGSPGASAEPAEPAESASPIVLCVNNLSASPQAATLALPPELGRSDTSDLIGGGTFPRLAGDGTLTLTLAPRGFFWLRIHSPEGCRE